MMNQNKDVPRYTSTFFIHQNREFAQWGPLSHLAKVIQYEAHHLGPS